MKESREKLIIGDVHGKINEYWKIIQKTNLKSIQVGDFGFKKEHEWHLKNIDSAKHKINFGNHDDYAYLNKPHSLGNYSVIGDIMTVRGADSIDKAYRIKDISWWEEEELTYDQMQNAIDSYMANKPSIMISHDCPQGIREHIFSIHDKSITSNGLQVMFEYHQPDMWVFGHHHKSISIKINGTKFICLNELETIII